MSSLVFSTVMWARLDNNYVIIVLFVTICFGGIGFIDDYLKVSRQNPKGVSSKVRLLSGFLVAAIAAYFISITHPEALQNRLALPIFKNLLVDLGFLFVDFCSIEIAGDSPSIDSTSGFCIICKNCLA